jgi:hypothetical protein
VETWLGPHAWLNRIPEAIVLSSYLPGRVGRTKPGPNRQISLIALAKAPGTTGPSPAARVFPRANPPGFTGDFRALWGPGFTATSNP